MKPNNPMESFYCSTKNEPELSVGRSNGKTLKTSAELFERAIRESIKGKKPDGDFSCIEIRIPDYALTYEYRDEFIGAIINDLKRHISDKVSDILSSDDEYIVSLSPSRVYVDPIECMQKVRVQLKHKELVRCKDCVYCRKASFTGELMCSHPSFIHHIDEPDGYCHHGRKPRLADYLSDLLKEEPDEQEGKK